MQPHLKGLYFVTPEQAIGRSETVAAALRGGAAIVQYRDKTGGPSDRLNEARSLLAMCREAGALFLVNDDVALCRNIGADGVHLGEDDTGIAEARRLLGPDAVIGASCYNDLERARRAEATGADYVAFGAIFPSTTKPDARRAGLDLLRLACRELGVPICAIGGITPDNAAAVVATGAHMIAVIQGISEAADPEAAARRLRSLLTTGSASP